MYVRLFRYVGVLCVNVYRVPCFVCECVQSAYWGEVSGLNPELPDSASLASQPACRCLLNAAITGRLPLLSGLCEYLPPKRTSLNLGGKHCLLSYLLGPPSVCLFDRVSLCSLGRPWTHSVDQTASASWVLGLKACTTTAWCQGLVCLDWSWARSVQPNLKRSSCFPQPLTGRITGLCLQLQLIIYFHSFQTRVLTCGSQYILTAITGKTQ